MEKLNSDNNKDNKDNNNENAKDEKETNEKEINENNINNEESKKKEEEEEDNQEENKVKEKINSVPIMMRCFLCEDYCEEPVQILCCNEIFCKKHITEEIMKNFACPNCHKRCGLNNIIENKKLSDDIKWFKKLLNELIIGDNDRIHI